MSKPHTVELTDQDLELLLVCIRWTQLSIEGDQDARQRFVGTASQGYNTTPLLKDNVLGTLEDLVEKIN